MTWDRLKRGLLVAAAALAVCAPAARADALRSEAHEAYAKKLWSFMHEGSRPYTEWSAWEGWLTFGPPITGNSQSYANRKAAAGGESLPYGSMIVTDHRGEDGKTLVAVTARYRVRKGYDPQNDDWYWVHFLPDGRVASTSADKNPWARRGFVAMEEEGRLWVFLSDSDALAAYRESGPPAKHVTRPAAGPLRTTIKAPDSETAEAYARVARRG